MSKGESRSICIRHTNKTIEIEVGGVKPLDTNKKWEKQKTCTKIKKVEFETRLFQNKK